MLNISAFYNLDVQPRVYYPGEATHDLYLAGPMSGIEEYNFPEFRRLTKSLRARGFSVQNPAETFDHSDRPYEFYMRAALAIMLRCRSVALLTGWESSRGARLEVAVARALQMPVYLAEVLNTYRGQTKPETAEVHVEYTDAIFALDWEGKHEPLARMHRQLVEELAGPLSELPKDVDARKLQTLVNRAVELVSGDRQGTYGSPVDDFSRAGQMPTLWGEQPMSAEQHAFYLIGVKISRLVQTPDHYDSMVDLVGYLLTYYLIRLERARRHDPSSA